MKTTKICGLVLILLIAGTAGSVTAQVRDYMNDQEIELIRDAQDIDLRIETLVRMIDRRFFAAGIQSGGVKVKSGQEEKWGPEPTGLKAELYNDITRLLQKGIDDIDDIAGRNELAQTQNRMEGKLFPKAVRNLASSCTRFLPLLKTAENNSVDRTERGNLLNAMGLCEEIVGAAQKLPADVSKDEKKKSGT